MLFSGLKKKKKVVLASWVNTKREEKAGKEKRKKDGRFLFLQLRLDLLKTELLIGTPKWHRFSVSGWISLSGLSS